MIKLIKTIIDLFTDIRLSLAKHSKLVILFNYHRIGNVDRKNPFHRAHTVSHDVFKSQIRFLSRVGNFVSLKDIRNNNLFIYACPRQ